MTDQELIQMVIDIDKDVDLLSVRGAILDIPNCELRNALIGIFDAAWHAGEDAGKREAKDAEYKFNRELDQVNYKLDDEIERLKGEVRKMRKEVEDILDDTSHVISKVLDASKLEREEFFDD